MQKRGETVAATDGAKAAARVECASTARAFATAISLMFLLVGGHASTYSLSVLMTPLENEFNATRSEVSYVLSFQLTSCFLMGLPAAFAFKTFSVRHLLLLSSFATIAGNVSATYCTALWQVYCTLGLAVGVGAGTLSVVEGLGPNCEDGVVLYT